MECKMCKERGKTWNGSDPKCAFKNRAFNKNNWNCATVNAIRDIAEENKVWSNDEHASLIRGLKDTCDFVLLEWYKHRGKTDNISILNGSRLEPITIDYAEKLIREYGYDE